MMVIGVIEYIICGMLLLGLIVAFFKVKQDEFGVIALCVVIIGGLLFFLNPITQDYIEQMQWTKEENTIFREKARIEQIINDEKELQDAKDFIKDYKENQ